MDLIGQSTLYDTSHKPTPPPSQVGAWLNFFSHLIGQKGETELPPDRLDKQGGGPSTGPTAAQTDEMMNGPGGRSGVTPSGRNAAVTVGPSANIALPGTPDFKWGEQPTPMVTPGLGWDGKPKEGWMETKPAMNFQARTPAHFESMLMDAKNPAEFGSIVSANSDWTSKYGGARKIVDRSRQVLDRRMDWEKQNANELHQQEMEKFAKTANEIKLRAMQGVGKLAGDFTDTFNYVVQHGDDAQKAQAMQLFKWDDQPGGVKTPNPEAFSSLSGVRQSITAKLAADNKLMVTKLDAQGRPVMEASKTMPELGEIPEPVEKTVGGKKFTVLRTGPNSFQWKSQAGETKPLSDSDALAIAKGYKEDTDARKFWMQRASSLAVERMTPEQRTSALNGLQSELNKLNATPKGQRVAAHDQKVSDLSEQLKGFNAPTTASAPNADSIRAAFKAGTMSKEDAVKQLKAMGFSE